MSSSTSSELHKNIIEKSAELKSLYEEVHSQFGLEDLIYRFYHRSFKVYFAQNYTERITKLLEKIAPRGTEFCQRYADIYRAGTDKKFDTSHNLDWDNKTKPIVEAFLHATYFLDMAVKHIDTAPEEHVTMNKPINIITPGWAALLELYNIR